jgi:hypothetical protein
MKPLCLLVTVVLGLARVASAQTAPTAACGSATKSGFTFHPFADADREWYAPLIAEPRGAHSELLVWGQSRSFPFMSKEDHLTVWDISFGKELPVAAWDKGASDASLLDCRGWGFGLWVPGSFHMIADAGEDSSPILNHDYRLAVVFKVAHGVTPRDLVSAKVQVGHESTHVGDEFVVRAINEYGDAFQRINVSYEYVEAGVNWDHFFGLNRQQMVSLRVSGVHTASFGTDAGWYGTELIDGTVIHPSRMNFEPAVGVEYMPRGSRGWRPFASYEGRLRTIYDYAKTSADQKEGRQFSSSLVLGLRNLSWAGHGAPDVIVKGYYGVNPNGQFRSQANYWMWGVGLLLRL